MTGSGASTWTALERQRRREEKPRNGARDALLAVLRPSSGRAQTRGGVAVAVFPRGRLP